MNDISYTNPWIYNTEDSYLELYNEPGKPLYKIDLERCKTSAEILDWIVQVSQKTWGTDAVLAGLVRKLDEVLNLQGSLCGQGLEKRPIDVRSLLLLSTRQRVNNQLRRKSCAINQIIRCPGAGSIPAP